MMILHSKGKNYSSTFCHPFSWICAPVITSVGFELYLACLKRSCYKATKNISTPKLKGLDHKNTFLSETLK